MNKLQKARKILKLLDIDIKTRFSGDFAIMTSDKGKSVMFIKNMSWRKKIDLTANRLDQLQKEVIQRKLSAYDIFIDYDLFSLLHEIGHLKTAESMWDTEYNNDTQVLTELFNKNLITPDQYVNFYNDLKPEKNADSWAVDFVLNNKNFKKVESLWK